MREAKSLCRLCSGSCGTTLTIEGERVIQIRGDRAHPFSRGYACPRGLQLPEMMNSSDRLLRPMKRNDSGSFSPISLEQALDEIAIRLGMIIAQSGAMAVGLFKGTQTYFNAVASQIIRDWMSAIGSKNYFTTNTIDQSAHLVTMHRMGYWDAGKQRLNDSDVVLLIGTNPLLSLGAYQLLSSDPTKRLKDAKKRGLKVIVIDPRKSETAIQADCFVQPIPGQDAVILAGLIKIILENGWEDKAFCDQFADGIEALRAAVSPFSKEFVSKHAGIPITQIDTVATMFAREGKRGIAVVGTGGTMGPHSNLIDHLAECLNALCGRYLRAGERIPNPGVVSPLRPFRAEVVPHNRAWERSSKSSTGHGEMAGERMSGILADEMLLKGEGRVRALIVNGANPAVSLPNQLKAVSGLKSLDLLVSIEPFMSATAALSHYIIPPKLMYERAEVMPGPDLDVYLNDVPFSQYVPPAVCPPTGAEVIDDWYFYWALAKRLAIPLSFAGIPMDLSKPAPATEEMLEILLRDSRVTLPALKAHPEGHIFDDHDITVLPGRPGMTHRLQLAPDDVITEITAIASDLHQQRDNLFPYRLIVRRSRDVMNSLGRTFSSERKHTRFNPLHMNPDDIRSLGITVGERVSVACGTATIPAIVAADETLRHGVVSMTHCWGFLPGDDYSEVGLATSQLVRTDSQVEPINAMPVMTAIPIRIIVDNSSPHLFSRVAVGGSSKRQSPAGS